MKAKKVITVILVILLILFALVAGIYFAIRSNEKIPTVSTRTGEEVLAECVWNMALEEDVVLEGEDLNALLQSYLTERSPGMKISTQLTGEKLSVTAQLPWEEHNWTLKLSGPLTWQEESRSLCWAVEKLTVGKLPLPFSWVSGLLKDALGGSGVTLGEEGILVPENMIFPEEKGLRIAEFSLRDSKLRLKFEGASEVIPDKVSKDLQEVWADAKEKYPELESVEDLWNRLKDSLGEDFLKENALDFSGDWSGKIEEIRQAISSKIDG